MADAGKDSDLVVRFMSLYAKLREWTDDNPLHLRELASSDEGVQKLCNTLQASSFLLSMGERKHEDLFAAPVDPGFLLAWRDYEERFGEAVGAVWLGGLLDDLAGVATPRVPRPERRWENADDDARQQAGAIQTAIDFALEQLSQDWRDFPEDFSEEIEEASRAWDQLKEQVGFDLRATFRRRQLVPFILFPRHVATRLSAPETDFLIRNLREAHKAFILGAPLAALALIRSVVEAVLRDHYGAAGVDLSERIERASAKLPKAASAAALHRLRKRANAVLHIGGAKSGEPAVELSPEELEKEVISLLFVLRALIEGVPRR